MKYGRNAQLGAAYRSMAGRSDATLEQFVLFMAGWDLEPVIVGDTLAGTVAMRGPVLHACILPQYFKRWLSRSVLRRTLARILAEYGHATTSAKEGNEMGAAFVTRLGFTEQSTHNGVTTYQITRQENGN